MILAPSAPIVSITSAIGNAKFNPSNALVIQGTVTLTGSGKAWWAVSGSSIDLAKASLTPVRSRVGNAVGVLAPTEDDASVKVTNSSPQKLSTLEHTTASDIYYGGSSFSGGSDSAEASTATNLVIAPNALPQGATLTFTLYCSLDASQVTALSSITIITNSPPQPGLFSVQPLTGVELTDPFKLTASLWTDADTPISYQFGFLSTVGSLLVVQSRSLQSYGASMLPAGGESSNHKVVCLTQVFDAFDSNTTVYGSVTVVKLQANQTQLASLVSSQLSSSSGNVDKMKQAISTISGVLNAVDCSSAPNCASLHRTNCLATAHTCGPCLPGGAYVCKDGDSNYPCVAIAAMSQPPTLLGCTSSQDCGGWQLCDTKTNKCYTPAKTCDHDCFGHGTCTFSSIITGASVMDCSMSDTSCQAVCSCSPGFNGIVCSVTDEDLKQAQNLRGQLLTSMGSLVATENPSPQAVDSWSSNLGALTANPIEVASSMVPAGADIIDSILRSGSGLVTTASTVTLLGCVNSLSQVIPSDNDSTHRRLDAASSSSLLLPQVDVLSQLLVSGMVEGQSPHTVLLSNIRTTSQVTSPANPALAISQTPLEAAAGVLASQVQAEVAVGSPLTVSSISGAAFHSLLTVPNSDSTNQTSQTLNANPLRLQYKQAVCSSGSRSTFVFTMVHGSSQDFIEHNHNETHSLHCTKGVPTSATFLCASGANLTIICDGSDNFLLTQACPVQQSRPTCYVSAGSISTKSQPPACHVANYSKFLTTCVCDVCRTESELQGPKRRLQTGEDVSSTVVNIGNSFGVATVLSLTETSMQQFTAVAATAGDFNSAAALRDSLTVILAFLSLWLGMFLLVVVCHRNLHGDRKRLKATHQEMVERSLAELNSLEDSLQLYMTTFFPHVYTDQSGNARFGHALFHHHAYLRVFATEGLGFEKWVLLLGLLTDITTSMFLLAFFYNLQFPEDDGSCKINQTEAACIQRRSPFDHAKHQCGWQQSSVYEGSTAPPYQCVWLKPAFELKTLVEIAMIVNFIANPIYFVTGYIVEEILLATTHEIVKQQTEVIQERRSSVQHFMAAMDALNAATQGQHNKRERRVSTFSTTHTVDETLFKTQRAVRQSMKADRLLGKQGNGTNGNASDAEKMIEKFNSVEELFQDLQSYAAALNHRVRDQFLDQWSIQDAAARTALTKELEDVKKCSAEWISTLKAAPQATVGVRLLQLFVQDLIGRSTRQASIFVNQLGVQQISEKRVVTWGMKCLAFTVLFSLNFFFVFMCMLYGRSKGLQWQKGWLITSCVNLMVDIVINQVTVAVVVYYLIPNTIFDTTKMVKATINHAVAALGKQVKEQAVQTSAKEASPFSATDYLFVSTRVAKAFPDCVESAVILAYRSQVIAQEQSERWTKAQAHKTKRSRMWASPLAAMSLVASYLILSLGSQSLSVQEVIVYAVNPALFGAALQIGSFVSSQPYIAFPVGTAIVFGCAVAVYFFKKAADKRSISLRVEGFMQRGGGALRHRVRPGQVMPLGRTATTEQQGLEAAEIGAQSKPEIVVYKGDGMDDLGSEFDSAELLYDIDIDEGIEPQADHSGHKQSKASGEVRLVPIADILGVDWAKDEGSDKDVEFDDEWMYNYFIYGAAGADSRMFGVEGINDDNNLIFADSNDGSRDPNKYSVNGMISNIFSDEAGSEVDGGEGIGAGAGDKGGERRQEERREDGGRHGRSSEGFVEVFHGYRHTARDGFTETVEPDVLADSRRPDCISDGSIDWNGALEASAGQSREEVVDETAHRIRLSDDGFRSIGSGVECEAYIEVIQKTWAEGLVGPGAADEAPDDLSNGSVEYYIETFEEGEWP